MPKIAKGSGVPDGSASAPQASQTSGQGELAMTDGQLLPQAENTVYCASGGEQEEVECKGQEQDVGQELQCARRQLGSRQDGLSQLLWSMSTAR